MELTYCLHGTNNIAPRQISMKSLSFDISCIQPMPKLDGFSVIWARKEFKSNEVSFFMPIKEGRLSDEFTLICNAKLYYQLNRTHPNV